VTVLARRRERFAARPSAGQAHEPRRYAARQISKSFSGTSALAGVSVTFEPGEIHTLVGENGAGKSTLLKIMAGVHRPDAGELVLGDDSLRALTPRSAQQAGIYLVPQEPTLMANLSALENLFVGILPRGALPFSVNWKEMQRSAGAFFAQVGLDIDPHRPASTLSIAQQQLLECARALAHNCKIIFFDEPTSPLTAREAEVLFALMRRLREREFTLGFISHRLDEVLEVSDRITVLRDAAVVAEMAPGEAARDAIVRAMVGHEIAQRVRRQRQVSRADAVLETRGLSHAPDFTDISLTISRGEVVGLAGLVGSGRTEVAEAIFGLRAARGEVLLEGKRFAHRNPHACIEAGLIYLPEDRGRNGIFADVELARNITAAVIQRLPRRHALLSEPLEERMAADAMERTHVIAQSPSSPIRSLSGGNQQRAMFARWLLADPKVAIFDEPTRGVDVGAKADIYEIIDSLADAGVAILMISSELEELTLVCDRIIAIYEGRAVGELVGDEIALAPLGALIIGEQAP
jgi:ABC-type sugar transport system ATPase subunit